MKCTKCDKKVGLGDKYCASCGEKIMLKKENSKTSAKKILYFVIATLSIIVFFYDAILLQLMPFFIFLYLGYVDIWKGKSQRDAIVVLSVLMALINITLVFDEPAVFVDVIVWGASSIIF